MGDDPEKPISGSDEPEDLDRKATKAALRLISNVDPDRRDAVLDGIVEMGKEYSPITEEDANIAKLQKGMLMLAHMSASRITELDRYIGHFFSDEFGSSANIATHSTQLESARLYSSTDLLEKAFSHAALPDGSLDNAKLREFMTRSIPSRFWQNQQASLSATEHIEESYELAKKLSSGLEKPLMVKQFMERLKDLFRQIGMRIDDLPVGASDMDKKRWEKQIQEMVDRGWDEWLELAQAENQPIGE